MNIKVANKRKFVRFLGLLATLISLIILLLFQSMANAKSDNDFREYRVRSGDSLWSISLRFFDDDPREIVYKIKKENNIDDFIRPGQVILIPR